jgi:hypothetical protein
MRPLVHDPKPSYRKAILSVALAVVAFFFGVLIDQLGRYFGASGWSLWLDDIAVGALLGLVVHFYERRRERSLIEKLKVIELMNHHVRNALQPVMYLPYSQDRDQQLQTINEAVSRIEWALREILPGAGEEGSPTPVPAAHNLERPEQD